MQIAIHSPGLQSPAIHSPGLQSPGTQNPGIQRHGNGAGNGAGNGVGNGDGNGHSHARSGQSEPSGRGARLVARHDQNNDAKLSTGELQGTRLGKKMSVDRFSRLDSNGDGQLEAGELNRKKMQHHHGPGRVENALIAKFADLLAEKPTPTDFGQDIAKAVLARLDKDGSDGLNSEEIAGTRLAAAIGSDFYDLDGDKNGALDAAELSAFITNEYLKPAQSDKTDDDDHDDHDDHEGDDSDEGDDVATSVGLAASSSGPISGLVATKDAGAVAIEPAESPVLPLAGETGPVAFSQASYADQVRSSLETALALLQQGSAQHQLALDAVRTLYAQANGFLGSGDTT